MPTRKLLAEVAADPWGEVAVSIYDTARLVALAPWLAGHRARLTFLCRHQHADGGWGWPDGYSVVPTLSATTALLTELRRRDRPPAPLVRAATAGLAALQRWLAPGNRTVLPDTIGVELIVPALLEEAERLAPGVRLALPPGFDARLLAHARSRFAAGALPAKSWACLEVFGPPAVAARSVRPAAGSVGCSAAATAAWLGGPDGDRAGHRFLDRLQARGGGPVPGVTPITYFEAAWVLNSLVVGGFGHRPPATVLDRLAGGLGTSGAPAAAGLPADADDTAAVLAALLRHGRVRTPDCLLPYRTDGYFTCFPDERSPSVSTNAHVLEALALYLARRPAARDRFGGPAALAAQWLLAQQSDDGSWWDKWHASAYYATACCVLALSRAGSPGTQAAIDRARAWVRQTQRPDGSWGRWQGTVEESAYAVQILALAPADPATATAIRRGYAFLAHPPPLADHPPLWHAKDLYLPSRVVRAARLAALRLAARQLGTPIPRQRRPSDPPANRAAPGPAAAGRPAADRSWLWGAAGPARPPAAGTG